MRKTSIKTERILKTLKGSSLSKKEKAVTRNRKVYKRKKRVTAEGKYSKDSGTNTLKVIEDEK